MADARTKFTVYFPGDMLEELRAVSDRTDRSPSWLLERAWEMAKGRIVRVATPPQPLPRIGRLLRTTRVELDCSLRETAEAVGVRHVTLGRWERDEGKPSPAELERLCDELGIDRSHPAIAAHLDADEESAAS